MITTKSN